MKYKFNNRKLTEYFGSYDMRGIVENIITRIDEEEITNCIIWENENEKN